MEAGLTILVPFSSVYDFPHHPVLPSVQDSRVPTRSHMLRLITHLLLGISFRMGWNHISGIVCRVLVWSTANRKYFGYMIHAAN
jgi:hypothetical protein